MTRKWVGLAGAIGLMVVSGAVACAFEADFDPSIYNPGVLEIVNFEVCEPCLDDGVYSYQWDFDADGTAEIKTEEPLVTYAFPESGFYEVELTVADAGGRTSTRRKGILVGDVAAFAVRELLVQSDGTILVLITVYVTSDCNAIGIEETMPTGWQVEVVDAGGAFAFPNPSTKTIEVVWGSEFAQGDTVTFSYRLHPAYASDLRGLSGDVSGYTEDGRFIGRISGELGMAR